MTGLTLVDKTLPYPRPDGRIPTKSYGFAQWVDFNLSEGHDPNRKYASPSMQPGSVSLHEAESTIPINANTK